MGTSRLQSKLVGGRFAGAVVRLLTAICLFVLGCAKPSPPDTFEEPEQLGTAQGALVTLTSVSVTPPTATLPIGVTQVFKAAGLYSNGTTRTFTSGITWSSSAPAVATIAPDGTATSVSTGVTTITALHAATGLSATASLTVTAETLVSVAVTPVTKSTGNSATVAYTATGKFSGGTSVALKGAVVAWSSSDAALAPVDAAGKVLTAATGTGIARISATHVPTGIGAPVALLQVVASPLVSISVTGSASALIGTPVPFHATGVHANGMTSDLTAAAVWTSSKPTVATITPGGVAIAVAAGTTTIRAVFSGLAATAPLNVPAPVLVGLAVTPPSPRINMGTTGQLFATGTYNDLTARDRTEQSTWSSSAPTIVKVSATAGTRGKLFPLKVGSATITARDAATGLIASTVVTVTNITITALAITPGNVSGPLGVTVPFQATATYSDATTRDVTTTVTWSATGGAVTISNAAGSQGVATATAPGVATVTAQVPATAITANATFTVTPAILTQIEVSPASSTLVRGLSAQLTATGVYSDGARVDMTADVGWTSSDESRVAVSNDPGTQGLARTSTGLGAATVTAMHAASGLSATATITVTEPALVRINLVEPGRPLFAVGDSFTMQALGVYASGPAFTLNEQLLWQSSDTGLIVVSNAPGSKGRMTAVGAGTATITATDPVSGVVGTRTYTANAPRVVAFSITPTTAETEVGVRYTFSAFGTYSDGSVGPVAPEWQIVGAGGSITPEGAATASSVGTFDVRARVALPTPVAHATLTVVESAQIQVAVGSTHACALIPHVGVKCWGENVAGQLGLGDTATRGDGPNEMGHALPTVDLGVGRVPRTLVAGEYHTCALFVDGDIKCWGANNFGQLGQGDINPRGWVPNQMGDALPPVNLGPGAHAKGIATGDNHTCALLEDGTVKCWGWGITGALGLGDPLDRATPDGPVALGTARTAKAIFAGGDRTCAILDDDSTKCWGYNYGGNLGIGDAGAGALRYIGDGAGEMGDALPALVFGAGRTARQMSLWRSQSCAVLDDGTAKCWGENPWGKLGLGDTNQHNSPSSNPPIDLGTGRTAVHIETSGASTCALLDSGALKCWGWGGQLGLGDPDAEVSNRGDEPGEMGNALPVVDFGANRRVVAVAGSTDGYFRCAALDDSSVKCWGYNFAGNLGTGDSDNALRGDAPGEMGDALPAVHLLDCAPQPGGLVSWWRGEGDALDALHLNDGIASGGTSYALGFVGTAFQFDGTGAITATSTGFPTGSAARTMEAWVRVDAALGGESFFAGYGAFGTGGGSYGLGRVPSGELFFSQWGSGVVTPVVALGAWHHLAVTSVGNQATIYFDGVAASTNTMPIDTVPGLPMFLGSIPGDTYRRTSGMVDEVGVYNRALAPGEIATQYFAGNYGKCH